MAAAAIKRIPNMSRIRAIFISFGLALYFLWAFGQLYRDNTWLTGLCFYIPSALLCVSMLGWVAVQLIIRQFRAAVYATCLALLPLAMVLFIENNLFTIEQISTPNSFRLAHWNVAGGLSRSGQVELLLAQGADLYVLSEVPDSVSVESVRKKLGDEYTSLVFGNLAVIGTGTIQADGWLLNRGRAKVQSVIWEQQGNRTVLFVVDLPSEVYIARDPLLHEVNQLIKVQQPDIVVGDFNAPRRSWGLSQLPAGYGHAYDAVGSGFGYTWPVPLPLYALDHCIISSKITPRRYELVSSRFSDHRLQLFEFSMASGD